MAKKKFYTIEDFENGKVINCEHCGKYMPRIQWTHLKHGCKTSITLEEYKKLYPNKPLVAENVSLSLAITLENMIKKYGEEEGKVRWDSYRNKQAKSNTFEYKQEKYGWTQEQFDEYNQSRAVTKENLIKRHGKEKGLEIWDNYIEKQRYTCSKEYFIKEYGEREGTKKYERWDSLRQVSGNTVSNVEIEFFDELEKNIEENKRQERIDNCSHWFDYVSHEKKKIIEFYGSYWHCDPNKYADYYFHNQIGLTAQEIRLNDEQINNQAKLKGYDVYIVWENDWYKNKYNTLKETIDWWNT